MKDFIRGPLESAPGSAPGHEVGAGLVPTGHRPRWQEPSRSTLRALRATRSAARRLAETRRTLRRR